MGKRSQRKLEADHVENDQLEKTTSIFGTTKKQQTPPKLVIRETDHQPKNWNTLKKSAENAPIPQKSPIPWIIAAAAGVFIVICIGVAGLFLLGNEPLPAATAGSSMISSVSETVQPIDSSDQTAPTDYLETVRDSEGRIIRAPKYEYDGSVTYVVYEYDAQGNWVSSGTYNLLGELENAMQREFDRDGNCIRINYYDGSGNLESYSQLIYQNGELSRLDDYDLSGQMTDYTLYEASRRSYYTPDGTLKYAYEYEYDAQGNPLKISHFNEEGVLSQYTLSEYGEDGQLTSEETYYADGRKIRRTEYDEFHRNIREVDYYNSGMVSFTTEYEYDDGGFRSREKQSDNNGQLTRTIDYTYNQRGKKADASWYDGQGVLQYTYEYGEKGQLEKKTIMKKENWTGIFFMSMMNKEPAPRKTASTRMEP